MGSANRRAEALQRALGFLVEQRDFPSGRRTSLGGFGVVVGHDDGSRATEWVFAVAR
jgi:hypothetical protein